MQPKIQSTGAYLDGISEGRQFLKANPELTLEEMQRCRDVATLNMRRHSFAMKDCFRGERDFWNNQIKKAQNHANN